MSSFVEGLSNRKKMHANDLIAQKQRQQDTSEYVPLTLEQILQMQNVPVQGELLPKIDPNQPVYTGNDGWVSGGRPASLGAILAEQERQKEAAYAAEVRRRQQEMLRRAGPDVIRQLEMQNNYK